MYLVTRLACGNFVVSAPPSGTTMHAIPIWMQLAHVQNLLNRNGAPKPTRWNRMERTFPHVLGTTRLENALTHRPKRPLRQNEHVPNHHCYRRTETGPSPETKIISTKTYPNHRHPRKRTILVLVKIIVAMTNTVPTTRKSPARRKRIRASKYLSFYHHGGVCTSLARIADPRRGKRRRRSVAQLAYLVPSRLGSRGATCHVSVTCLCQPSTPRRD